MFPSGKSYGCFFRNTWPTRLQGTISMLPPHIHVRKESSVGQGGTVTSALCSQQEPRMAVLGTRSQGSRPPSMPCLNFSINYWVGGAQAQRVGYNDVGTHVPEKCRDTRDPTGAGVGFLRSWRQRLEKSCFQAQEDGLEVSP